MRTARGGELEQDFAYWLVRGWWPRITQPVLVVSFEHDDRFRPHHGEAMAAAIPGARHVVVDGAGHGGAIS